MSFEQLCANRVSERFTDSTDQVGGHTEQCVISWIPLVIGA
jgi:hypothetical protein